ncbi:hypothetical protein [Nonomuraea dietziae]|uniref:hypothetical protein n=1 Tax=Nonomuraea dietziae TaxID=65515 RepID=UPI0031D0ADCD
MHEEQLYRAALAGNLETVSDLLAGGADPNVVSEGEDEGLPLCGGRGVEPRAGRGRAACRGRRRQRQGARRLAGAGVGGATRARGWSAQVLIEAGAEVRRRQRRR